MNITETKHIEREIIDAISKIQPLIKAHKGFVVLQKVEGNRAYIYNCGMCIECDINCIKKALEDKFPDINFIFY